MVRRRHRFLVVAAFAAVLAFVPSAGACVLAEAPLTPAQKVMASGAAFTGRVAKAEPAPGGGALMTIAVDRVLKGRVPSTVRLTSGMTSCSRVYGAGTRIGVALSPTTPEPWSVSVFDDVGAALLDPLPVAAAYARLKIAGVSATPGLRKIQIHVTAHACTELLPALAQTPRGITVSVLGADGPRCTSMALVDRCVTLTAKRRVGRRAVLPRAAPRVAPSTACQAFARSTPGASS
jgi:hypothetical protein